MWTRNSPSWLTRDASEYDDRGHHIRSLLAIVVSVGDCLKIPGKFVMSLLISILSLSGMVLKDFLRTLLGIVEQGYEVVVLSFSVDTIEFSLRINTFSTLWKVVRKSYRSWFTLDLLTENKERKCYSFLRIERMILYKRVN